MNIDYHNALDSFPKLELSYEISAHKKVHNSDIYFAIPDSTPFYLWFTSYMTQNVCFLIDVNNENNIKLIQCGFIDNLAYGTILYGYTFKYKSINCFCIDNIYYYKGKNISKELYINKLEIIKVLLKNDVSQYPLNKKTWILGLPFMETNINKLLLECEGLPYKVKNIKCRMIESETKTLLMTYYKPGLDKSNVGYEPTIFKVKAELNQDIYNLYAYNPKTNDYEYYDVASIPDYKTSVFMNTLFRNIKENGCLDLLEESDDEMEFENEKEDKYVDLNKSIKMLCEYNCKFKKWVPKKRLDNKERVVTINEINKLKSNEILKENNKKYNQPKKFVEKKKYNDNIYVQKYRK